jgi:hypothetical protein
VELEFPVPAAARGEHLGGAEDDPHERRQQDHHEELAPAEESGDRGGHLEIAVAHSLHPAKRPEARVHRPQHHVSGDGADDRVGERHERPRQVGEQAKPYQRQRDVVGQVAGLLVDQRKRDDAPEERRGRERLQAETEMIGAIEGAHAGEQLDDRVSGTDARLALRAFSTQHEVAEDRYVPHRADAMSAGGTA